MSRKEMMAKMFVTVLVKRAILSAAMVNGYLGRAGPCNGQNSDPAAVSTETVAKATEPAARLGAVLQPWRSTRVLIEFAARQALSTVPPARGSRTGPGGCESWMA